jgi:uncharacterized protein (TIGR02246 family)
MSPAVGADAEREIRALVARYFAALDTRDFDLLRTCFTEDADAEYQDGAWSLRGRDEIVAKLEIVKQMRSSIHLTGAVACEVDGFGAKGTVFAVAWLDREQPKGVAMRGLRYDDRYREDSGQWRIEGRRHRVLWAHELGS